MKYLIEKERLQLMSPGVNVCAVARWNARLDTETLKDAIRNTVRRHAILNTRAVIDADGTAYFAEMETEPEISLAAFSCGVEQLILEQERRPFAIDQGETVRFFLGGDAERPTLVVIAHHLVCDGGSIMILMRDILRSVNGQEVAAQPICPFTREDLPAHAGLNLFMRIMMRNSNARWAKSGKVFHFDEYRTMFEAYATTHPTVLALHTISAAHMSRLRQQTRERRITINSLVATAFAATLPLGENIGIPVDVRPENRTGIGNYAIGFGIKAAYDEKKSLMENAEIAHRLIRRNLSNPKQRYFLYEFMGALAPTLTDSIYFCGYGGYQNPIAKSLCSMCGYVGSPKGITITNIKSIQMPEDSAWPYQYEALSFVPPYIPNVRSVIGVSTYTDEMTLSLRTVSNNCESEERERFDRVCRMLEAL